MFSRLSWLDLASTSKYLTSTPFTWADFVDWTFDDCVSIFCSFGSKSKRGTEVAATFYTLLETAKLCGVDPAHYLREAALADARGVVLLPHDLAELGVIGDADSGSLAAERA